VTVDLGLGLTRLWSRSP